MKTFELKKDDLLLIALTAEEQDDLIVALECLYLEDAGANALSKGEAIALIRLIECLYG